MPADLLPSVDCPELLTLHLANGVVYIVHNEFPIVPDADFNHVINQLETLRAQGTVGWFLIVIEIRRADGSIGVTNPF